MEILIRYSDLPIASKNCLKTNMVGRFYKVEDNFFFFSGCECDINYLVAHLAMHTKQLLLSYLQG